MAQAETTARWFNNAKGYTFLGSDEASDVFVKFAATETDGYRGLNDAGPVQHDLVRGKKHVQGGHIRQGKRSR